MTDSKIKSNSSINKFGLHRLFRNLDALQDWIVFCLCVVLIIEMILLLGNIFFSLRVNPDFKQITSDSLFLLILVELFRLLAVYLHNHHIYVGIAAEVTVVSVLREIILEGILHMNWSHILAIGAFLLALAALIFVDRQGEYKDSNPH